jgi:cold shock CspA family protein
VIGEVISFSRLRGWGFIHPDSGTEDIFVFRAALENARYLVAGEVCEFQIGEHSGRSVATNVFVERNGGRDK